VKQYESETLSFALRKEHRQRVYEKQAFREERFDLRGRKWWGGIEKIT
jgi:hypothetical protein